MTQAFNYFAASYWRPRTERRTMQFTHDFRDDLNTLLAELDSGRPFAFSRFADGELAILEGRDIPTADGWSSVNVTDQFRERLLAALQYRHPDYYLGIGCPCCDRGDWERLMKLAGREPDDPQVTFSTLFVNGNWEAFRADKRTRLVLDPKINMVNVDNNALDAAIEIAAGHLHAAKWPLYIAAGPAGKIIVHELWLRGFKRFPLIDIGSAFDTAGRSYHIPGHPNRTKVCQWAN